MNNKTAKKADAIVTLLIAVFFVALIVYIWQDFYGRMTNYACDSTNLYRDWETYYRDWETDRKSTRLNSSHRL